MSDLAENFYNAWMTVMGPGSNRLWCNCHVDHAWRNNLSKIKTQAKRCEAYKMLKKLITEKNEDQFKTLYPVLVQTFLVHPELKAFGEYLRTYYMKNTEYWAYCYTLVPTVTTT